MNIDKLYEVPASELNLEEALARRAESLRVGFVDTDVCERLSQLLPPEDERHPFHSFYKLGADVAERRNRQALLVIQAATSINAAVEETVKGFARLPVEVLKAEFGGLDGMAYKATKNLLPAFRRPRLTVIDDPTPRCIQCSAEIPPGKPGRKCKQCRGLQ